MKHLTLAAAIVLAQTPAFAQSVPITLSAQEYDGIVGILISRDPILSGLVQKQNEARMAAQAAAAKTTPAPAQADVPKKD